MPPDGKSDTACPTTSEEDETMPMLQKDVSSSDAAAAADLTSSSTQQQQQRTIWRFKRFPLPVKHAIKVLVFVDMFAVAIVLSMMTTYFKDLNIRWVRKCCTQRVNAAWCASSVQQRFTAWSVRFEVCECVCGEIFLGSSCY